MAFVLGGVPMLAINPRQTKSEKDEQKGIVSRLIGLYGRFRNPTCHEARVHWPMTPQDARDIMSMVSLPHRRPDGATMPPRV